VSLPVVLDPEARDEFDQAYDHYERQRAGLGERFADAVQAVLDRIGEMPWLHRTVVGDIRRAVVHRFPYCVYYVRRRSASECCRSFTQGATPGSGNRVRDLRRCLTPHRTT